MCLCVKEYQLTLPGWHTCNIVHDTGCPEKIGPIFGVISPATNIQGDIEWLEKNIRFFHKIPWLFKSYPSLKPLEVKNYGNIQNTLRIDDFW